MAEEKPNNAENKNYKFSDYRFLIPFGRYRLDNERNVDNASVYIGREGHRAFLTEALNGGGRRGAFLITGRRGVGKTTFVESCIDEYENATFRRFLRSNYGRSGIDLFMMLGLAVLSVIILIVCSNSIEILAVAQKENPILWIPLLALIAIVLIPLIYGFFILNTVVEHYRVSFQQNQHIGAEEKLVKRFYDHLGVVAANVPSIVVTILVSIGFFYLIYWYEPFGAPTESMSRLLLMLSFVGIFSLFFHRKKPKHPVKNFTYNFFVLLLSFGVALGFFGENEYADDNLKLVSDILLRSIFIGFLVILLTFLINFIKMSGSEEKVIPEKELFRMGFVNSFGALIFFLVIVYMLFPLFLGGSLLEGILLYYYLPLASIAIILAVALSYFIILKVDIFSDFRKKLKFRYYVPPIEAVIITKVFLLFLISCQLIYPILGALKPTECDSAINNKNIFIFESGLCLNKNELYNGYIHYEAFKSGRPKNLWIKNSSSMSYFSLESDSDRYNTNKPLYYTLFPSDSLEEIYWLFLVVFISIVLYYIEYEWICRPYIAQRQTNVLDNGPRLRIQTQHDFDPVWQETEYIDGSDKANSVFNEKQNLASEGFRKLERTTYVYLLCSFWMPSIVAKINLGFDALDHRGVIHSMLYSLRQEYNNKLLSWRSPYYLLIKLIWVCMLIFICSLIGRNALDFPEINKNTINKKDGIYVTSDDLTLDYCQLIINHKIPVQYSENMLVEGACSSFPSLTNTLVPAFYYTLLEIPVWEGSNITEHFIEYFLHYNHGLPIMERSYKSNYKKFEIKQNQSLNLRVYHILTFILLIWFGKKLSTWINFFPYKKTFDEINEIIDDLNMRKKESRRTGRWSPVHFSNKAFGKEVEAEFSRDERDPRAIELNFLNLLERMQNNTIKIPFVLSGRISVPTPEVHFIFDELDKITGMVGTNTISPETNEAERSLIQDERRRAFALHSLLSDMKRVISSAPARFMFVGSRMLHDEWMADQGRRQPLLSSIFDAEIYLPSLMLDLPRSATTKANKPRTDYKLTFRIEEYLLRTHNSSRKLYQQMVRTRFSPFYALPSRDNSKAQFYESRYDETLRDKLRKEMFITISCPNFYLEVDKGEKFNGFIDEFINFLTYRSAGTPKKIDEILSSFMRQSAHFTKPDTKHRYTKLPCRDVLALNDREIYRIQFINDLFKHLLDKFETVLVDRDDKVSVNIIYLFDFLMKFHQRAFSWSSLDRIDELSHMHRAPDIRTMFEEVVEESAEKMLHKIFHGLYAYRFRSDFSAEVKYLSRRSKPEMAAFNFTLDESQELKAIYTSLLDIQGTSNVEVIEALGELHEYDQAYETARGYYEKALMLHDEKFGRYMGNSVDIEDVITEGYKGAAEGFKNQRSLDNINTSDLGNLAQLMTNVPPPDRVPFIKAIMMHDKEAIKDTTFFVPWIVRRVRLMLQIGLTFELELDFERAQAHYHAANWLTRAATEAAFPMQQDNADGLSEDNRFWAQSYFKHIATLLLQPIFSEAWIAEKVEAAVDTSAGMVESYLIDVRKRFPFLNETDATQDLSLKKYIMNDGSATNKGAIGGSNFALLGADLHNKAGDLYFFKGRDSLSKDVDSIFAAEKSDSGLYVRRAGYLLRAQYHYAVSLHELRRFSCYRTSTSGLKFNTLNGLSTFEKGSHTTYEMQSFADKFFDFNEAHVSRISIDHLISHSSYTQAEVIKPLLSDESIDKFYETMKAWLSLPDEETVLAKYLSDNVEDLNLVERNLYERLGYWSLSPEDYGLTTNIENSLSDNYFSIVKFTENVSSVDTLISSLLSSLCAARLLSEAGFYVSATNEIQIVLQHVLCYLKWLRIKILLECESNEQKARHIVNIGLLLAKIAVKAFAEHDSYFLLSNNENVGRKVYPVKISSLALSLCEFLNAFYINAEALDCIDAAAETKYYLEEVFANYLIKYQGDFSFGDAVCFSEIDFSNQENISDFMIKRYKYPALENMIMLKNKIDNCILCSMEQGTRSTIGPDMDNLKAKLKSWFEELRDVEKRFDAAMLFSPSMLAETAFLMWRYHENDAEQERYRKIALVQVRRAIQMFTQGREYYKTISKMYYLFDEFNDRTIHANHAIQMAGADMLMMFEQDLTKKKTSS